MTPPSTGPDIQAGAGLADGVLPLRAGILVGREREVDELRAGLEAAAAGRGGLLLVMGEPGIGKTRLLEEAAAEARLRGMLPLFGRAWEGGGAPAFWLWVQVIRAVARAVGDDLMAQVGAYRLPIAALVPELGNRGLDAPQLPASSPMEPESARFALFDSAAALFRGVAATRPLVLLLDDLHAADRPSLLLLRFLLRDLVDARLLVVGAYRDVEARLQPELDALLGDLSREGRRLPLRGLGPAEVGRFIEMVSGIAPAPGLVSAVHRVTDGNPFFLDEVVRVLASDGRLAAGDALPLERLRVPAGVREAIRRRLLPLGSERRAVLAIAAVLGHEFDLQVLQRASELSPERILEVLGEAARAGILLELPSAPGRCGFSHTLVRESLYDDLPPARRVALHRRAGEVLERLHGTDLEPYLAELAHHFLAAVAGGDASKAVRYGTQAGNRALRLLAYEDAAAYFARALQALGLAGSNRKQRCDLLLALGEAQDRAGDTEAARRTFEQAADTARELGDPMALGRAAIGFGGQWALVLTAGVRDESRRDLLEEALAALPGDDSTLRAKVLGRLGLCLRFAGTREEGAALSAQAVAMARRLGDGATLAYTLCNRHATLLGPDDVTGRLETANEILRLAETTANRELALRGHALRAYDLLEIGDVAAADRDLEAHARAAQELRRPFDLWLSATCGIHRALLDGRFDEAERASSVAAAMARRVPGQQAAAENAQMAFTIQQYTLRRARGGLEQLASTIEHAVERYPAVPAWRGALSQLYCLVGRTTEARREFEQIAANEFGRLPRDAVWLGTMAALAELSAAFSDTERAAALYQMLLPYADRNCTVGFSVSFGPTARYLGLLATALSRPEEAALHFERALGMARRMAARPWLAHAQGDYAAMLLRRDAPGDRARAQRLAADAGEAARELGMPTLAAETAELCRRLDDTGRQRDTSRTREAPECLFFREGEYWTISYEETVVRLRDMRGLGCLAFLIRHPGREFHASELAVLSRGVDAAALTHPPAAGSHVVGRDGVRLLDERARAAYRRRLEDLREEADVARQAGDAPRVARAEEEIQFVTRELVRDLGLGGRERRTGSPGERARLTVTKAIRAALAKIVDNHPTLGRHLAGTVKTGSFCSYTPDARRELAGRR
jgi:tetratricopeptide (TPR) repeat protein